MLKLPLLKRHENILTFKPDASVLKVEDFKLILLQYNTKYLSIYVIPLFSNPEFYTVKYLKNIQKLLFFSKNTIVILRDGNLEILDSNLEEVDSDYSTAGGPNSNEYSIFENSKQMANEVMVMDRNTEKRSRSSITGMNYVNSKQIANQVIVIDRNSETSKRSSIKEENNLSVDKNNRTSIIKERLNDNVNLEHAIKRDNDCDIINSPIKNNRNENSNQCSTTVNRNENSNQCSTTVNRNDNTNQYSTTINRNENSNQYSTTVNRNDNKSNGLEVIESKKTSILKDLFGNTPELRAKSDMEYSFLEDKDLIKFKESNERIKAIRFLKSLTNIKDIKEHCNSLIIILETDCIIVNMNNYTINSYNQLYFQSFIEVAIKNNRNSTIYSLIDKTMGIFRNIKSRINLNSVKLIDVAYIYDTLTFVVKLEDNLYLIHKDLCLLLEENFKYFYKFIDHYVTICKECISDSKKGRRECIHRNSTSTNVLFYEIYSVENKIVLNYHENIVSGIVKEYDFTKGYTEHYELSLSGHTRNETTVKLVFKSFEIHFFNNDFYVNFNSKIKSDLPTEMFQGSKNYVTVRIDKDINEDMIEQSESLEAFEYLELKERYMKTRRILESFFDGKVRCTGSYCINLNKAKNPGSLETNIASTETYNSFRCSNQGTCYSLDGNCLNFNNLFINTVVFYALKFYVKSPILNSIKSVTAFSIENIFDWDINTWLKDNFNPLIPKLVLLNCKVEDLSQLEQLIKLYGYKNMDNINIDDKIRNRDHYITNLGESNTEMNSNRLVNREPMNSINTELNNSRLRNKDNLGESNTEMNSNRSLNRESMDSINTDLNNSRLRNKDNLAGSKSIAEMNINRPLNKYINNLDEYDSHITNKDKDINRVNEYKYNKDINTNRLSYEDFTREVTKADNDLYEEKGCSLDYLPSDLYSSMSVDTNGGSTRKRYLKAVEIKSNKKVIQGKSKALESSNKNTSEEEIKSNSKGTIQGDSFPITSSNTEKYKPTSSSRDRKQVNSNSLSKQDKPYLSSKQGLPIYRTINALDNKNDIGYLVNLYFDILTATQSYSLLLSIKDKVLIEDLILLEMILNDDFDTVEDKEGTVDFIIVFLKKYYPINKEQLVNCNMNANLDTKLAINENRFYLNSSKSDRYTNRLDKGTNRFDMNINYLITSKNRPDPSTDSQDINNLNLNNNRLYTDICNNRDQEISSEYLSSYQKDRNNMTGNKICYTSDNEISTNKVKKYLVNTEIECPSSLDSSINILDTSLQSMKNKISNNNNKVNVDTKARDYTSVDTKGIDYASLNRKGIDYASVYRKGKDCASLNRKGRDYASLNRKGIDYTSVDTKSRDYASLNRKGRDYASLNTKSRDYASLNRKGRDYASLNRKGIDYTSVDTKGRDYASLDRKGIDYVSVDTKGRDYASLDTKSKDYTSLDTKRRDYAPVDTKGRDCASVDRKESDYVSVDTKGRDYVSRSELSKNSLDNTGSIDILDSKSSLLTLTDNQIEYLNTLPMAIVKVIYRYLSLIKYEELEGSYWEKRLPFLVYKYSEKVLSNDINRNITDYIGVSDWISLFKRNDLSVRLLYSLYRKTNDKEILSRIYSRIGDYIFVFDRKFISARSIKKGLRNTKLL